MKVTEAIHGRYILKAGMQGNIALARAFFRPPTRFRGHVSEATGKTVADALLALKEKLKERDARAVAYRRHDAQADFDVPSSDEYREALAAIPLSKADEAMLFGHAKAGDDGLTATEIAAAGGYRSHSNANAIYGKVGQRIRDHLRIDAPKLPQKAADHATGILATEGPPRDSGEFVWVMFPELRAALEPVK